jgi:hypothetical protein
MEFVVCVQSEECVWYFFISKLPGNCPRYKMQINWIVLFYIWDTWCRLRTCNICTCTYILWVSKRNAYYHSKAIRRISSSVTWVRFVSTDLFYAILRVHWCDITHIILNLHPASDDMMCCRIFFMNIQSMYSIKSLCTSKFCSFRLQYKSRDIMYFESGSLEWEMMLN